LTNQKCNIPQWGEAWSSPHVITNIFSYAEIADKYCVTLDSMKDNAFTVHLPDKLIQFEKQLNGPYVYMPNQFCEVQLLSAGEENIFLHPKTIGKGQKGEEFIYCIRDPYNTRPKINY
jgi:predicted ferric reductase